MSWKNPTRLERKRKIDSKVKKQVSTESRLRQRISDLESQVEGLRELLEKSYLYLKHLNEYNGKDRQPILGRVSLSDVMGKIESLKQK